jgi:hypothetical protein
VFRFPPFRTERGKMGHPYFVCDLELPLASRSRHQALRLLSVSCVTGFTATCALCPSRGNRKKKTQNSPLLPGYRNVPSGELEQRVYEIYRHLADWLLGKRELDVEKRYLEIGSKRAQQGVPQSHHADSSATW